MLGVICSLNTIGVICSLIFYIILVPLSVILLISALIVNRNTKNMVRQCNLDIYEVYGVMKDIHDKLKEEVEDPEIESQYDEKQREKDLAEFNRLKEKLWL